VTFDNPANHVVLNGQTTIAIEPIPDSALPLSSRHLAELRKSGLERFAHG
jgi:hypothetical protein